MPAPLIAATAASGTAAGAAGTAASGTAAGATAAKGTGAAKGTSAVKPLGSEGRLSISDMLGNKMSSKPKKETDKSEKKSSMPDSAVSKLKNAGSKEWSKPTEADLNVK